MARHGKLWRRKGRGWYVQIHGKQHSLGRDKAEAFLLYHQLMQAGPVRESQQPLVTVCDEFLDWNQKHRSEETYLWYRRKLQSFISATLANWPALRWTRSVRWMSTLGWPCTRARDRPPRPSPGERVRRGQRRRGSPRRAGNRSHLPSSPQPRPQEVAGRAEAAPVRRHWTVKRSVA
jgi:hypothetical protein